MSETCRVLYQINVRNSASRWFSLQERIWRFSFPLWLCHCPNAPGTSISLRVSKSICQSSLFDLSLLYPPSGYNLCVEVQITSETSDASKCCPKICVTSRKRMLTLSLSKAIQLRHNMYRDKLWSGIEKRKFFNSHPRTEIFSALLFSDQIRSSHTFPSNRYGLLEHEI
jgi:hypothetical protein